jgi:hypothetical protein
MSKLLVGVARVMAPLVPKQLRAAVEAVRGLIVENILPSPPARLIRMLLARVALVRLEREVLAAAPHSPGRGLLRSQRAAALPVLVVTLLRLAEPQPTATLTHPADIASKDLPQSFFRVWAALASLAARALATQRVTALQAPPEAVAVAARTLEAPQIVLVEAAARDLFAFGSLHNDCGCNQE